MYMCFLFKKCTLCAVRHKFIILVRLASARSHDMAVGTTEQCNIGLLHKERLLSRLIQGKIILWSKGSLFNKL